MDSPYPRPILVIAAFLTALGIWYVLFGAYVLANLSSVTQDWIGASGDPDFRFDFDIFAGWAGVFSVMVMVFGGLSAAYGAGILARREWADSPAWFGITLLAVLVHLVRLPIQRIDKTLTWPLAAWFGLVVIAYAAISIAVKRRIDTKFPPRSPATVEPGTGNSGTRSAIATAH